MTRVPSGLNTALQTSERWPLNGSPIGLPVAMSHSRTVLSRDAVTKRLPSAKALEELDDLGLDADAKASLLCCVIAFSICRPRFLGEPRF
jgi:hypothetical protein